MYPIKLASPAAFRAVRDFLAHTGYDETALCRRLGTSNLSESVMDGDRHAVGPDAADAQAALIRLFLEGRRLEAAAPFPEHVLAAFLELGLVERGERGITATVALYPVEGLCIASDRWNTPDRTPPALPEDIVYPALVSTTRKFLAGMPRLPCGAFLELCAGTGIAALLAARDFARHAWAFDIAPRSVHFAEFNARLNGIGNITTGVGDLFDPAGDLTFDCIVAHPPYVPVRERKWIYMDGGEDGEEITRRIIQALPRYLRPDGRFYVRALAAERKHARYEDRVREWLAAAAPEFDLALIISKTLKPDEYAMLAAVKSVSPLQEMRGWHDVFDKLEITGLHQGITVLRRFRAPRPPFTVRRMAGPESGPGEIEWLLGWEAAAADGSALAAVLASELCADTRTELRIESRLRAGEWTPTEYVLAAGYPFQMELRAQAWIPHLLALCAGRGRTGHELLDHLRQEGIVHPETRPEEFADALLPLISGGFLRFAATSNVSG